MRKLLVLLLAVFAISGVTYTQEVRRSLSFYLDSFTGDLTERPGRGDNDTDEYKEPSRIFGGNEYEIGVIYSQNFATAQWLTLAIKVNTVGGSTPEYSAFTGDYLGNSGYSIFTYATPRAMVGLNFGGYSYLGMDTRGLIANENFYTITLPGNAGSLTFNTILEIWAIPRVANGAIFPGAPGEDNITLYHTTTVVDLFSIRVDYAINFAPGWTYRSKLAVRFNGCVDGVAALDSKASTFFNDGFSIRWENQVVWSVTPSFYLWTQVRYSIENLAHSVGVTVDAVDHRVNLQAGLGYSFDFSDN